MTKTKVLGYLALVLLCTAVVLLLIALRGSYIQLQEVFSCTKRSPFPTGCAS